ncbi:ComEA family DNA-binding protein [Pengzhenrongella frigida]|uniref:ComEA family DNA-binding protein n=1 Tax=Pengzhenrongella frigida TaxID=1259133 RepID=A0A4Q5N344_9MICO|nr:ComEA family DNA-binding protein [Cellulomonas sp. HLT2-17]
MPAPSPADVVVHVVGQVNAPGVVHLPTGSRVADAVSVAGGAAPGAVLAAVNLARVVQDGEQIVVPALGEVAPGTTGAGGAAASDADRNGADQTGAAPGGDASTLLDLNTADATDLESLPGIGPVLAQRIVDWRTEHTRFTAVDELGEVAGIGDTLLGRLRELVRV